MRRAHISIILSEVYKFNDYRIAQLFHTEKELRILLKKTRKTGACASCGKRCRKVEEEYERTIKDLDFVTKRTFITFKQYKMRCSCGYRGVESLDFVDKYSFHTKRFEEYVAMLCQKMSITDVASLCKINWKSVKNIDKKALKKLIIPSSKLNPEGIGVDEVAYKKGHNYLTIVRDIDLKKVIWIGIGRKEETLDGFFKEIGEEKSKKITVAVLDMWDAYIASIRKNAPQADLVFDKFHISKKVNEALDSVRKSEFRGADKVERKNMKRKRFIILSRNKNLNKDGKQTIKDLKEINEKLYVAYLLKEQILNIFDESNIMRALSRFAMWFSNVEKSGFAAFKEVAKTLKNYLYGIMNYFYYKITNAGAEAINNKINIVKRRAYGFKDIDYFMLKILQSCGWRSS